MVQVGGLRHVISGGCRTRGQCQACRGGLRPPSLRLQATSCPRSPSPESPPSPFPQRLPCQPWTLGSLCRRELPGDCPGRCATHPGASRRPSPSWLPLPLSFTQLLSPRELEQAGGVRGGGGGPAGVGTWVLTSSPAGGVEEVGGWHPHSLTLHLGPAAPRVLPPGRSP